MLVRFWITALSLFFFKRKPLSLLSHLQAFQPFEGQAKCVCMGMAAVALLEILWSPVAASEAECDVKKAAGRQWLDVSEVGHNIAARTLDGLTAFQAFVDSRDWEDGVPMVDQMSAKEAVRFEELRLAMANRQLASLIQSKRERDILAISRTATIAEAIANEEFEAPTDENSEEYILAGMLFAAREHLPMAAHDTFPNAKDGKGCELISTLTGAADQAIKYANDYPFLSSALEEIKRLNEVYPDLPKARDEMSERDKKALLDSHRIVLGAKRRFELANDYLRLALMEETSQLLYEASMRDLFQSPGDIEAVGTTWQRWVEAGRVSEKQVLAAGLLFVLKEQIPADIVTQWQARNEAPSQP